MQSETMINTVLQQSLRDDFARVAAWRQLTDILARDGERLSPTTARSTLYGLAALRRNIGETTRRETATALAPTCRFAPLASFFAADVSSVSGAFLAHARLTEQQWLDFLPASSSAARAQLAQRRDLPAAVQRALIALGAGVVTLPGRVMAEDRAAYDAGPVRTQPDGAALGAPDRPIAPPDETDPGVSQISELVRRIARFQDQREQAPPSLTSPPSPPSPPSPDVSGQCGFRFLTRPDGIISQVEGMAGGAVVGVSIARQEAGGAIGVDGAAAGAFRQRAPINNARMVLRSGQGKKREWRISARPQFDAITGQFQGYVGEARRPVLNEKPYPARDEANDQDGGDGVRQLVHELRSPLNAISGFAQIISGQMFGPVSQHYRQIAANIVDDARKLQMIIDVMDTSMRLPVPVAPAGASSTDVHHLLSVVEGDLADVLASRGVSLAIMRAGTSFHCPVSPDAAQRMIGRLLSALIDVAQPGETVAGQLLQSYGDDGVTVQLRLNRPVAIRHSAAAELLDPGFSPEGEAPDAAYLGLGFSLRLVANLSSGVGGSFTISANGLTLSMPYRNDVTGDPLVVVERERD